MGWDNKNGKHFGHVCATCDSKLGRANLMKYMSLPEVITFEYYLKETVNLLEYPDFPDWLNQHKHLKTAKTADSITILGLSSGIHNALRLGGITTINELMDVNPTELLTIRMLGAARVQEIQERLKEYLGGPQSLQ